MKEFALINNNCFPLTVITELDGLAKGIGSAGTISQMVTSHAEQEHCARVARAATDSVVFLETEFEKRNKMLRAVTSGGHVRESITFRSEEMSGQVRFKVVACETYIVRSRTYTYAVGLLSRATTTTQFYRVASPSATTRLATSCRLATALVRLQTKI